MTLRRTKIDADNRKRVRTILEGFVLRYTALSKPYGSDGETIRPRNGSAKDLHPAERPLGAERSECKCKSRADAQRSERSTGEANSCTSGASVPLPRGGGEERRESPPSLMAQYRPGNGSGAYSTMQRDLVRHNNPVAPTLLVNTANQHSPPLNEPETAILDRNGSDRYKKRRAERWKLRHALQTVTRVDRLRACGTRLISPNDGVRLKKRESTAYYEGVQTCGSIWLCPVCGAKVRQKRADEIAHGSLLHLERGGFLESSMLTIPHEMGNDLDEDWGVLQAAVNAITRGKAWQTAVKRYSLAGYVRSMEQTHTANGWHPHAHLLWFFDRELSPTERAAFGAWVFGRFSDAVAEQGRPRPAEWLHRLYPVRSAAAISEYVAKAGLDDFAAVDDGSGRERPRAIGYEMARSDLKTGRSWETSEGTQKGRTPHQIAADYLAAPDPVAAVSDLRLWQEYEHAVTRKRRSAVRWSYDYAVAPTVKPGNVRASRPSLKARFGLMEKTDEQLAAEKVGGVMLAQLDRSDWALLTAVARRVLMLEVAEAVGGHFVRLYLDVLRSEFSATGDLAVVEWLDTYAHWMIWHAADEPAQTCPPEPGPFPGDIDAVNLPLGDGPSVVLAMGEERPTDDDWQPGPVVMGMDGEGEREEETAQAGDAQPRIPRYALSPLSPHASPPEHPPPL